jgi:SAM-dependent methyltransferase
MRDFFTVGPFLELSGRVYDDRAISLNITQQQRHMLGWIIGVERDGFTEITATGGASAMSRALCVEAHRLHARICNRIAPSRATRLLELNDLPTEQIDRLHADGFEQVGGGDWVRPPGEFTRTRATKAASMEEVYENYFEIPWNVVGREWDLLDFVERQGRGASSNLLDAGCGFGKNATALEALGVNVWGADISREAIRRCREVVQAPAQFVVASAASLPWPTGFFDQIVDVGCLHCARDHATAIVEEYRRVLGLDGTLYLRAFRPRSPAWCAAQPFECESFGFDDETMHSVLRPFFKVSDLQVDAEMHYLSCRVAER